MSRIVVVTGVAGAGKTSVGRALAARWACAFLDADDFHPPANVAKMRAGEPLTDADRAPWLDAMRARLRELVAQERCAVFACSALKSAYRQRLAQGLPTVRWVYLRISRETARTRMARRTDHFMPPALVDSQFEALEEPADALVVNGEAALTEVIEAIDAGLRHEAKPTA